MNFPQICFWLRVFQVSILPQYPALPEHAYVATRPLALHFRVRRMDENAQWVVGDFLEANLRAASNDLTTREGNYGPHKMVHEPQIKCTSYSISP